MKVAFYTLGCKVNQYETEVLAEKFVKSGCEITDFDSIADIYVINTCTVTAISDKKSRQAIRQARERNKNAIVVAAGCYPQAAASEVKKMPEVDIIVGTENKYELVELALAAAKKAEIIDNKKYLPYTPDCVSGRYDRTRATIKIEDGCNNFCSYCKIPYARGRVRSKNSDDACKEFASILSNGYNEIVVTGIEVASYGFDTGEKLDELLKRFDKLCGKTNARIRLGSLEPRLITEDFAKRLSEMSHICPQFHLSMQSGCDATLKRMNRKYDTALYENSVKLLRKYIPDTQITTDLIVGFPGESDEEFEQTMSFLEKTRFLKVHIFPYSKRTGTPAAKMNWQIEKSIKTSRCKKADTLCESIRAEILQNYIGTTQEVLFEAQKDGYWHGYTKNYIPVLLKSNNVLHNCFAQVKITSAKYDILISD